jgi:hypothetical protein
MRLWNWRISKNLYLDLTSKWQRKMNPAFIHPSPWWKMSKMKKITLQNSLKSSSFQVSQIVLTTLNCKTKITANSTITLWLTLIMNLGGQSMTITLTNTELIWKKFTMKVLFNYLTLKILTIIHFPERFLYLVFLRTNQCTLECRLNFILWIIRPRQKLFSQQSSVTTHRW